MAVRFLNFHTVASSQLKSFKQPLSISAPLQVYIARQSKDANVPWSVLNGLKFGLTTGLILLCLIDFGYEIRNQAAPVHPLASSLKIVTFLVVLGLQWLCKKKGLVTSTILFFFWTLREEENEEYYLVFRDQLNCRIYLNFTPSLAIF